MSGQAVNARNPRDKSQGYNKPLTINVPVDKCQDKL
jgi:hypothetical protein